MRRVERKELSINAASRVYGIPRVTLQRRLHHGIVQTPGPSTILSDEEETLLVNWILDNAKRGFGQTRDEILNVS